MIGTNELNGSSPEKVTQLIGKLAGGEWKKILFQIFGMVKPQIE